jgi:hypothetical protein
MPLTDRCARVVSRIVFDTMFNREGCGGYGASFRTMHPEIRDTDSLIGHAVAVLTRAVGCAASLTTIEPLMLKALPYYTDEHIDALVAVLGGEVSVPGAAAGSKKTSGAGIRMRRPPRARRLATPTECKRTRSRSRGRVGSRAGREPSEFCPAGSPAASTDTCEVQRVPARRPGESVPVVEAPVVAARDISQSPAQPLIRAPRPETAPVKTTVRFRKPWAVYVDSCGNRYVTDEHAAFLPTRQRAADPVGIMTPCDETFRCIEARGNVCRVEVHVPVRIDIVEVKKVREGRHPHRRALYGAKRLNDMPMRSLLGVEVASDQIAKWKEICVVLATGPPAAERRHLTRLKAEPMPGGLAMFFALPTSYTPPPPLTMGEYPPTLRFRATPFDHADMPTEDQLHVKLIQEDVLCECWVDTSVPGPTAYHAPPYVPAAAPPAPLAPQVPARLEPLRDPRPVLPPVARQVRPGWGPAYKPIQGL